MDVTGSGSFEHLVKKTSFRRFTAPRLWPPEAAVVHMDLAAPWKLQNVSIGLRCEWIMGDASASCFECTRQIFLS